MLETPLPRLLVRLHRDGFSGRLTITRHSPCSSMLLRSRKRQLEKARSVEPLPSDGSMKYGISSSPLIDVVSTRPLSESTHVSRRIGMC